MVKQLKQCLALFLALALCLSSAPIAALAESAEGGTPATTSETETQSETQAQEEGADSTATALPTLMFRTHALSSDPWKDDEGWTSYTAEASADKDGLTAESDEIQPVDSVEMKLSDEELSKGITYRIKNSEGTWQETYTVAGEVASAEQGIKGVQATLSEELDAVYDLWYRAQNSEGTWSDWVKAPEALEGADDTLLYGYEAVLTEEGSAPAAKEAEQDSQASVTSTVESATEATASSQSALSAQAAEEAIATEKESATITTEAAEEGLEAEAGTPSVEYRAHVQNIGWQDWVKDGATAGTFGRALRVEGFYFRLANASGGIRCQSHVQNIGWQDWVDSNQLAGTTGRALRVEAIKLELTGAVANSYDVYYRAHVQNVGWQGWVKNGEVAGTSGRALRIEAIEVLLVKKGGTIPTSSGSSYNNTSVSSTVGVHYQGHVQNIGWQNEVSNGESAGTSGRALRVEALRVNVSGVDGGIRYRTHVQNIGWQDWVSNGEIAGTFGRALRLEAMQIELTGNAANNYDVYYRTHVQNVGWMGWAKNGGYAGSSGYCYRMEAVQIVLVAKGSAGPSNDGNTTVPYLGDLTVSYNARAKSGGWYGNVSDGATSGATGRSARLDLIYASVGGSNCGISYSVCSDGGSWQGTAYDGSRAGTSGKNITAIRFNLTGDAANYYDIWYRAHVANVGWMGWACNGGDAGSDSSSYPVEAYEVRVIRKGKGAPGSTSNPCKYVYKLNGVDISGHDEGINVLGVDGDFFIIKATEGTQGTIYNPWYAEWANKLLNAGKLVGFYHYANGEDPIAEADSFYNAIKGFKGRAIACLDWEGQGNSLFDTGKDVAWCKKFLDRLKLRFGGTPLIYTSKSVTQSYDWSSVASNYPLWGAIYADYEPVYGYQSNPWQSSSSWGAWGSKPTIHQYTSTGVLANNGGIEYFDLDLFYGTRADWINLQA